MPMRVLPSSQAISRMEEAITWNQFLERDEAEPDVGARRVACRGSIICHRFGISRPTAIRRWEYALCVIAWRLNGREVHRSRVARRFVIAAGRRGRRQSSRLQKDALRPCSALSRAR